MIYLMQSDIDVKTNSVIYDEYNVVAMFSIGEGELAEQVKDLLNEDEKKRSGLIVFWLRGED